jgi:hypothetical protein
MARISAPGVEGAERLSVVCGLDRRSAGKATLEGAHPWMHRDRCPADRQQCSTSGHDGRSPSPTSSLLQEQ